MGGVIYGCGGAVIQWLARWPSDLEVGGYSLVSVVALFPPHFLHISSLHPGALMGVPNCKGTLSQKVRHNVRPVLFNSSNFLTSYNACNHQKPRSRSVFCLPNSLILLLQLSITCTIMNNELADNTNMSISYVNKLSVTQFPVMGTGIIMLGCNLAMD